MVIAESTRKLLGNLFELEELGTRDLKGIVAPVGAWVALRPSSAASRFDALHGDGPDGPGWPRGRNLELLLRRPGRGQKTGESQVGVALSGEARHWASRG